MVAKSPVSNRPEKGGGGARPPLSLTSIDRSDVVVSAILIVLCAVLYWDTTLWPPVPASISQNAPPTVFPRMLIGLVFVLALVLPFERVWKMRGGEDFDIGGHGWPKITMFLTAVWITLAVYFMPILGVLPVMFGVALVLPLMWGERRFGVVAVYSVGLPIVVALLFGLGLQVNLAFGWSGEIFRLLR